MYGLYFLAAHLRFRAIFALLKLFRRLPLLHHLITLWDPNSIRKRVRVSFAERRTLIDFKSYRLWVDLNDHIGFQTYIRHEPFEMNVYRIGRKLGLSKDDIVLDIGANIGTASVPFCAETGCELIAVEASRNNADLLAKNVYENRLRARLYLVALVAPDAVSRYIPLYIKHGNTGANSIHQAWNPSQLDAGVEYVPAMTLDRLVRDEPVERIKLVKIDVEGAEADVFRGGAEFLNTTRAPILMEYRADVMKRFLGTDMSDVLAQCQRTHRVLALDEHGRPQPFDADTAYENVLLVPHARYDEIAALLS
jgi:FkbM family methyltransferase